MPKVCVNLVYKGCECCGTLRECFCERPLEKKGDLYCHECTQRLAAIIAHNLIHASRPSYLHRLVN